jgi:hypothetical protein
MQREEWRVILDAVKRAARAVTKMEPAERRPQYGDWLIVAMYLWAVAHDRPQSWACDRSHYTGVFRPRRRLPSVSQFNRRMNRPRTRLVLQRVHDALAGSVAATALTYLDGKPLTVGLASKDPDARRGHVMGGFARGYKLHAWMTEDRRLPRWSVMPLNTHEAPVATTLVLGAAVELSPRSLVLADQNYDARDLHKAVDRRGGRLVLNPKDGGRRARAAKAKAAAKARGAEDGVATMATTAAAAAVSSPVVDDAAPQATSPRLDTHPVTLRQMGPARRELLAVRAARPDLVRMALRHRVHAEGILGNLCSGGGGLTGLPPWARRLHRVRRWVGGKIILYHAKLRVRTARRRAA